MNSRILQANMVWIYSSWRFLLSTDLDDPLLNEYFKSLFKYLIVCLLEGILPKFSLSLALNIINCNRFCGRFHQSLHVCLLELGKPCRVSDLPSFIKFYSFEITWGFHQSIICWLWYLQCLNYGLMIIRIFSEQVSNLFDILTCISFALISLSLFEDEYVII